jgi:hypothetical protein
MEDEYMDNDIVTSQECRIDKCRPQGRPADSTPTAELATIEKLNPA